MCFFIITYISIWFWFTVLGIDNTLSKSETKLQNYDTELNPIILSHFPLECALRPSALRRLTASGHNNPQCQHQKKNIYILLSLCFFKPAILKLITLLGKAGKIRELRFKTLSLLGPLRLKVSRDDDGKFKSPKKAS